MAMTLRLSDEQTDALRKVADAESRSMQAVAVAAIQGYVHRQTITRDQLLDEIMVENEHLFERLART